jgi:hypothetical protein
MPAATQSKVSVVLLMQAFFTGFGLGDGSSDPAIHFIRDHSGRPSGQAYVVFRTPEEARAGQVLDKEKIGKPYDPYVFEGDTFWDIEDAATACGYTPMQASAGLTSSCRRPRS